MTVGDLGPVREIDQVWVLACAVLIVIMQPGFALLETGMVRSKNSLNVAFKNVTDFLLSVVAFGLVGYVLMFGETTLGFVGWGGPSLLGEVGTAQSLTHVIFQTAFCGTAATIVSGAVAERIRLGGYLYLSLLLSTVVYPVSGHWVWGREGWLANLGFVDFAGAAVVHSLGGWFALGVVLVLGGRTHRFGPDARPMVGQDLTMSAVGTLLLWVGWFGFNGGSFLGFTPDVPRVLASTLLAGSFGGLAAAATSRIVSGYVRIEDMLVGLVAGLVAVTAGADIISPTAACFVAATGAMLAIGAVHLLERAGVDDVIGAVPAHAVAGGWGIVSVALVGDIGNQTVASQLAIQTLGVVAIAAWGLSAGVATASILKRAGLLRISLEEEMVGLNIVEHRARSLTGQLVESIEVNSSVDQADVDPDTDLGRLADHYSVAVERARTEAHNRTQAVEALRQRENEIVFRSQHDPLTGLPNRTLLEQTIQELLDPGRRDRNQGIVLVAIIIKLDAVIDRYGRTQSDSLTVELARRLQASTRDHDTLGRLDDDVFILVTSYVGPPPDLARLCDRISTEAGHTIHVNDEPINHHISIGVVLDNGNYTRADTMIRDVGIAARSAANNPSTTWQQYNPEMFQQIIERTTIETDLDNALDHGELSLYYQPIVHAQNLQPYSFEALLRWHHPTMGIIPPDKFIPIAESTGAIHPIGRWCINQATHQLAQWHATHPQHRNLAVNVNLSRTQLEDPDLPRHVSAALDNNSLSPSRLCLEITESILMVNLTQTQQALKTLKRLGVKIAMDDFGTGYSSLAALGTIPVDTIKIDRSFVHNLQPETQDLHTTIIESVVEFSKVLDLETVAEGVETPQEAAALKNLGCHRLQGYYFARPMPAPQTSLWLDNQTTHTIALDS